MTALPFDAADPPRRIRLLLLAIWAVAAGYLVAHHVMWRDEVRALTLALNGADVFAMLRGVRGEGHPALWYLLLRVAHDATGSPLVLQGTAAVIGAGTAALVALRAPFRGRVIALILAGHFLLFEYTVSARNYGMSALLLLAAAALPMRRGVAVGLLLALLCNTNVGAAILAGAFLLFRGVELVTTRGAGPSPERRALIVAAALAAIGVLVCFVTVYPPVNDAAARPHPDGIGMALVVQALMTLARALKDLAPWVGDGPAAAALLTALLLAGLASLARTPGGLIAGAAGLFGFALFHNLLYPGSYRHHALYLILIIALHWMTARGGGGAWGRGAPRARIAAWGQWLFVALLALQLPDSVMAIVRAARGQPFSHSRDMGALLRQPALADAVLVAAPDYLIEPLAYYAPATPAWLVRERRWGRTVRYVKAVRRDLTLGDVLAEARVHARTRRPVVIALAKPLDDRAPTFVRDGYVTTFATDPRAVRAFRAATVQLAAFGGSSSGEDYFVYRLR